jgi:DNA-directed RNA polymerase specialized sigma subunit
MPKKKARKKATRNVDPLDDALNSKQKLAAKNRAEDHALWQQWQQNPTQQTLRPLMRRFEPVVRAKVQQYKAPNVNTAAFRSNLKLHLMNAFETFDPNRASLRTHAENHLKRSMRFNAQHQNYAYIPEGQTAYIGAIDRAKEELAEDAGEEPSHNQIAQFINSRPDLLGGKKRLTPSFVARVQGSRRKDVISSSVEGDIAPQAASRNEAVLGLLRPALKADEQTVFDHIYGVNGTTRIQSTSALAKKLGKSPSQVSRLKSRIAAQYKKYL